MLLSTTTRAHDDAPKLAAALQRAEARIRELEQENSALRNELRWIDRLLAVPASIMSPRKIGHAACRRESLPEGHT
jgi:hypothetical protein